ncbi:MAG: hypothetical protein DRJ57_02810 [Thermoprotei archaeon]|nr:MAG: hypothetical protein DRJ57_02810 [Thermoprotei archaeon]
MALALVVTALAAGRPPQLFVVEVAYLYADGSINRDYVLVEWGGGCRLDLSVKSGLAGIVVRVDSSTPFKPAALILDNSRVAPSVENGVVLIEDFAAIDMTRVAPRPHIITVLFAEYEPKPPAYALMDAPRGEGVWGYLIEALLKNTPSLKAVDAKFTILAMRRVELSTSFDNVSLTEAVVLVTGSSPNPLIEALKGEAVELRVRPIYYAKLSEADLARVKYVYLNLPAGCEVKVEGFERAGDALGRAFPGNPSLLYPLSSFRIHTPRACRFNVCSGGAVDYVVSGRVVGGGSCAVISVDASRGEVEAHAYIEGLRVYSLLVYGYAPTLVLPSRVARLEVRVVDAEGEPVNNITVLISRTDGTFYREQVAVNGSCTFDRVPLGSYVVRAFAGGREVGAAEVYVGGRGASTLLRTSLIDIELMVTYLDGEQVEDYVAVLSGRGVRRAASGHDGVACFSDMPAARYNLTILRGDRVLFSGLIEVEEGRRRYVVVANITRLYVKLVDFLGRPLSGVSVEARGASVRLAASTGEDGVACFELAPGEYHLYVPSLGVERLVEVGSGGEYVVVRAGMSFSALLPALALLFVLLLVVAKVWGRRGDSVEVLDVEDLPLGDQRRAATHDLRE